MGFTDFACNLARVRERIETVQAREGLRGDVRIVAVTKGHAPAAVEAAHAAGAADVGENRIQEALGKQEALGGLPVKWHLIGHLQTNKAKHVPGRFALVHSVDSIRVGEALHRAMVNRAEGGDPLPVLIQVNVASEQQKSGCDPAESAQIAAAISELSRLRLRGLMTMAPLTDNVADQRRVFAALRRLRDGLAAGGLDVPELSMGMSDDYEAAVAEGATILRLGTVLFGERPI
ncbi:MAG: YggS family pyridoxal phosphate-dependent enzyme [Gemmatimonadota bacterium]|nr:MAG: YggS family pyridoxal phosphate-dependent enzyme [Gemmatimonadota bacterium]